MKIISWNVNGIRACINKGFKEFFQKANSDIFCIQETKCQKDQIELEFEGYKSYWNSAEKKGYSGTAIFTKKEPIDVKYGIEIEKHDKEGRVITLEYEKFYIVNIYTPNSKRELERLDYRQEWEDGAIIFMRNPSELVFFVVVNLLYHISVGFSLFLLVHIILAHTELTFFCGELKQYHTKQVKRLCMAKVLPMQALNAAGQLWVAYIIPCNYLLYPVFFSFSLAYAV